MLFSWLAAIVLTSTLGALPSSGDKPADDEGDAEPTAPEAYFESVAASMLTLNLIFLRSIKWGPKILWPLIYSSDPQRVGVGLFMLLFIGFSLICLMNLISGVFVSSLLEAAQRDAAIIDRESLSRGEVSLDKLKEAFRKFNVSGSGVLTLEEFEQGLIKHKGICKSVGLNPHQAGALYRQLDLNGSGLVNLEEFLVGLLKLTKTSKSIDMLSIDYQQQKLFRELFKLGHSYDRDFQLMRQYVHDIDAQLERLTNSAQKLSAHLQHQGGEPSWMKLLSPMSRQLSQESDGSTCFGPRQQILQDLERRSGFTTRFAALESSIGEMVADVWGKAAPDESAVAAASQGEGTAKAAAIWREILLEDVSPWFRRQLAGRQIGSTKAARAMPAAVGGAAGGAARVGVAEAAGVSATGLATTRAAATKAKAVAAVAPRAKAKAAVAAAPREAITGTTTAVTPTAGQAGTSGSASTARAASQPPPQPQPRPQPLLGSGLRPSVLTRIGRSSPWYRGAWRAGGSANVAGHPASAGPHSPETE